MFALNHIAAPRRDLPAFFALSRALGVMQIEIRNDLAGVPLQDGTPAATVRSAAEAAGVGILSINALQRFEDWNAARAGEATALADYAAACGARALVCCPTNSHDDHRSARQRDEDLRRALAALRPILAERGLRGLIEPLGFAECALRLKRVAVDAIDAVGGADVLAVLHDTFHHFLAGETEIFAARTGLVHISGVEDASLAHADIRDAHRVLIGADDIMDNIGQMRALIAGGYAGPFSFEPFSEAVHALADPQTALQASMDFVTSQVAHRSAA